MSAELLVYIFRTNSPLHDGAVIVRGDHIIAAGCVLPLSENFTAGGKLGTRHRAALGLSEVTDALIVVVSEETGAISLASNGRLIRNLNGERLRRVLDGFYPPPGGRRPEAGRGQAENGKQTAKADDSGVRQPRASR